MFFDSFKKKKEENKVSAEKIVHRTPTKSSVDFLIQKIGIPTECTMVHKDSIAECLEVDENSQRFWTVVSAWKKRLEDEYNVIMIPTYDGRWMVADPEDRIAVASKYRKQAATRMSRAISIADSTDSDRLCEESISIKEQIVKNLNRAKIALLQKIHKD